jgi:hypothetical protein
LPFRRGALANTIHGSQCCLTLAFVITPSEEIAEGGTLRWDLVANNCIRLIDPGSTTIAFCRPQAQVGVFRAGPGTNLPEVITETANCVKSLPAYSHSVAPDVPHHGSAFGHAHVGAANRPIELLREPPRPARLPQWLQSAARAHHLGVLKVSQQRFQPIRGGDSVIVKECQHLSPRCRRSCIARTGSPAAARVSDHRDLRQLTGSLSHQPGIMINHYHCLKDQDGLRPDRRHRLAQAIPAIHRARRDDYRYRRKTPRSRRILVQISSL